MATPVKKATAPRKTAAAKTAAPTTGTAAPMHRRGRGRFSSWADTARDVEICSVDDLYEFLEDTRAFFQEASSLVEVLAKQLDADFKAATKKKDSKFSWLGISFGGRFR